MSSPYVEVEVTRKWWQQPQYSLFHHVVSLITSQQIKFAQGRKIRLALYELCRQYLRRQGHSIDAKALVELTPAFIQSLSDTELRGTGLTFERCRTIQALANVKEHTLTEYAKVSGVGAWTLKGTMILCNLDPHVILHEDSWIRDRLGEMVDHPVDEDEVKDIFKLWKGHETLMSYFLWRIKPSGIRRLLARQPLERTDFV